MIIDIDTTTGQVSLLDAGDFTAFHAQSDSRDSAVAGAAMGQAGTAADEDDHVWVSIAWLIGAAPQVPEWRGGFDGMVGYASSKGWINEEGTHLKAHLESRS